MGQYHYTNLEDLNNTINEWTTTLDSSDVIINNNINLPTINASFQDCSSFLPTFDHTLFNCYAPFGDQLEFAVDSSSLNLDSQTLPYLQEDYYSMSFLEDEDSGTLFGNLDIGAPCKPEPVSEMPSLDMANFIQRKNKVKKLNGQPSKNLMAERRRRKRLNDRLSMLRSVVPKITKFEVERRNEDTRIEICCGGKPGLLQSTVTTLEALGLEIQHCVISCFNDFALQASCSEDLKKRGILDSEDIKQALVRNAGFGGRCV